MKKDFQQKKIAGYTIIETMIAVSLFIIIVVAGMGALLNANLLHEKSSNMRSIIDTMSFVLEDMSRNMRTGYNFQCFEDGESVSSATLGITKSCPSGWAVAFEFASGDPADTVDDWVYYIDEGKIFKSVDGANSFVQMTPDEVVIDPVSSFAVLGAEAPIGDSQQPLITIKLSGTITFKDVVTPFSLQTSVSQRVIDI